MEAKTLESRVKSQRHENRFSQTKEEIIARAKEFTEPLCESEGMELVHVEYQRETGGRVLRIYIDKPGGVRLDDCVHISRQLGDFLDVSLENNLSYSLEVSSPGPNRPLGKKLDFERFRGRIAKIRTDRPFDGQKRFEGVLLGISEDVVKILIDDKTVSIPFQEIAKARLVNYNGENECL